MRIRNPYELGVHQHSNQLPLFFDVSGEGTQPNVVWVDMVPFMDDEDNPCIGFNTPQGHRLSSDFRLASVGPRPSGTGYNFKIDHGKIVSHVADEVRGCTNVEQFITALTESFGSLIAYRYNDDAQDPDDITPANTIEWFKMALQVASPRISAEDLCSGNTAVTLRSIASAIGASPTSIKKEDVAQSIVAWEDANPLPEIMPECATEEPEADGSDPGSPIAIVIDAHCVAQQVYFESGKPLGSLPKWCPDMTDEGFYTFVSGQHIRGGSAYDLMQTWQADARGKIEQLVNMGLPQGEAANLLIKAFDQRIASTEAWAHAAVQRARQQVESSNEKMKAAADIVESLRLVREPSTNMTIEGEDAMVKVCGRKFLFHHSPDAPLGIPNYCHDYWSASQRLGTGGAKVTFDAADLFDVVLNEVVTGMVGPPGVGKTSIILHMGNTLGIPVHIIQFTKDKPIEQLIGVDKIRGGQQVFEDGEITVAMRAAANDPNQIHIITFDEFDHAPAEVQSEFHGVVEGRDYTLPSGEVLTNHGNMRFVLTRNTSGHGDTTGRHAAANVSDSAFNSRIAASFNVDYMQANHEAALMVMNGLDAAEAKRLVEFADKTRQSVASVDSGDSFEGMTEPVCLRHMLSYCNARARGVELKKALALCVVGQLPARDREVANELAINAMGIS